MDVYLSSLCGLLIFIRKGLNLFFLKAYVFVLNEFITHDILMP